MGCTRHWPLWGCVLFVLTCLHTHSTLAVFDAFCPHNGANLADGKITAGCRLQCPFHHVEFEASGAVAHVPWLEKEGECSSAVHSARVIPHRAFHGMVMIWFDPQGQPPTWFLEDDPVLADMRFCGSWLVERPIYMHLQEYTENTVDVQHFGPMHGQMAIPWTTFRIPGVYVSFDSRVIFGRDPAAKDYCQNPLPEHLFFYNKSSLHFRLAGWGRPIPRSSADAIVHFIGPSIHRFLFVIPNVGQLVMWQTHLPLNTHQGMAQQVRFRWYAGPSIPSALAWYVVGEWVSNWWADVRVWEEKIKRTPPALFKGDGPVQKSRAWFNQFHATQPTIAGPPCFDW